MLNTHKKLFLFRADANPNIGSGHVMRCLSLANALKATGVNSVFVSRHITENLTLLIKKSGHDTLKIVTKNDVAPKISQGEYGQWLGTTQETDAQDVINTLKASEYRVGNFDLVICDHYALGDTWETLVSQTLDAPIAAIDDLSNRKHKSQWLIDTTFGKTTKDYDGLIPADCKRHIGSEFALLRPEFLQHRSHSLAARDKAFAEKLPVKNILISMGGMDKDNISQWALMAIKALKHHEFTVDVLLGAAAPHIDEVKAFAKILPFKAHIHAGIKDVTPLLVNADICIGAAGSSTWERCCLGLPTINIVIANNQQTIARTLAEVGAILNAGTFQSIRNHIEGFNKNFLIPCLENLDLRQSISLSSREICDGRGIERIVHSLSVRTVKHNKTVALRMADTNDIRAVHEWQKLPETRRYANNRDIPSFEDHDRWMRKKLAEENCKFYIIEHEGNAAGSVRLDVNTEAVGGAVQTGIISIFIAPDFFGNGVASAALDIIAQLHQDIDIMAQVHESNIASLKLFARAGYIAQGDGWHRLAPRLELQLDCL